MYLKKRNNVWEEEKEMKLIGKKGKKIKDSHKTQLWSKFSAG